MEIIVLCEESQVVCKAFRECGHNAYSCDIVRCSGGRPEWHIQKDAREVMKLKKWDMGICHPVCSDLAVSGARWFKEKISDGRQQSSINFFMDFVSWDCDKKAIENPIGIMSRLYRKPDQIIHPWQFGHGETKSTCLWLTGLPPLIPTCIVSGRVARVHRLPPGPDRVRLRSKTYEGIASAMALQWG